MTQEDYHKRLKRLMDEYAHLAYRITKKFPTEERYGLTSQLRRASLSVVLNYIEGFARFRKKVNKSFLETSFGSLKESHYLIGFSFKEGFISKEEHDNMISIADEIGAMLWGILNKI